MAYGASRAEWAHFDLCLGLTADLLPVVSDPTIEISPLSKMKALGKTPSIINAKGQAAGIPDWTERTTRPRQVELWAKDDRLGICVQTRRIRALDIDVDHKQAEEIELAFEKALGLTLPTRHRLDSFKLLLAFELEGEWPKRSFKTAHGLVEFLGNGQQFVAIGQHPSGQRYQLSDELPESFPSVSAEQFEKAWALIVERFALPDTAYEAGTRRRSEDFHATDLTAEYVVETGLVLGEGRDGQLFVECPWKEGHSMDSGVTEAAWFPAGSGGYEQGHFKCLHASCAKRTDDEFREAIGCGTSTDFDTLPAVIEQPGEPARDPSPPRLPRNNAGKIESTIHTVMTAIEHADWFGWRVALDTFRDEVVLFDEGSNIGRPLTDDDLTRMRRRLERHGFKPIGVEVMRSSVNAVACERQFDSAVNWLTALEWDGVPRIETFLIDCFGAEDSPYTRAVSRYWWTGHAARVLYPGCRCDMVPILVSPEGRWKSSALAAMMPSLDMFVELDLEHKDDNLSRKMRGALLAELAELRGLKGRSAEANKAWVTRRYEEWTPKYREFKTRFFRRLMFCGTTNTDLDLLDDSTGRRRWLPTAVRFADRTRIARDRMQLWAEAKAVVDQRMADGTRLAEDAPEWEAAYELGDQGREQFMASDSWEEPIARYLKSVGLDADEQRSRRTSEHDEGAIFCTLEEIMLGALGLSPSKYRRADELRACTILRETCNFRRVRRFVDGKQRRFWSNVAQDGEGVGHA